MTCCSGYKKFQRWDWLSKWPNR